MTSVTSTQTRVQPPPAVPLSSPSEVKERHRDFAQQLWSFPLFVGVWGAAGVLVQHPEQSQAQYGLQWENSYCYGEVDPETDMDSVSSMEGQYEQHVVVVVVWGTQNKWRIGEEGKGRERGQGNHLQFIPLDVVEEAFVRAHSLGLDRFKQVLAIVGEGTHQEVLLITATKQHIKYCYIVYVALSDINTAGRFDETIRNLTMLVL